MGREARARGTFEERRERAIKRDNEQFVKRQAELAERERNKTPNQRWAERKTVQLLAMLAGMNTRDIFY